MPGTVGCMSELDEPEPVAGGRRAQAMWGGAVLLAGAATGVLVLSDDARLLRLGLVAALWAALIAAFAVAKLRHRLAEEKDREGELQQTYELELDREVAARQEFEVEAEAEARRRAKEESAHEVQALKVELRSLRQSLEEVLGGDVLFERVALRAESTRVRSLTEQGAQTYDDRIIQHGRGRELPVGNAGGVSASEQSTELISRISDDPAGQGAWPQQGPKPQQPQRMRPPRDQQDSADSWGPTETEQPPYAGSGTVQSPPPPETARRDSVPTGQSTKDNATPSWPAQSPPVSSQQDRPYPEPPAPAAFPPADPESAPASTEQPQSQQVPKATRAAAGAHTEGTSVTDLLAAYGNSEDTQRRRRRRD